MAGAYWDEEIYCSKCDRGHSRIDWNSLGMCCGRCGEHTGNNHQGHYWRICKVWIAQGRKWDDALRDFHFCCPDDCELEAKKNGRH